MPEFTSPLLVRPLDRDEVDRLSVAMTWWLLDQPDRFEHVYEPKESKAHDPFVRRQHKGRKSR